MGTYLWITAATVAGGVLCAVLVLCRKRTSTGLDLQVAGCGVTATHNERKDWRVRLQAIFANRSARPLNVSVVAFESEAADGRARLSPKRVTGDKTRIISQRGRGPDLAMRLPIALRPKGKADFTFDVFFSHSLHRFFGEGTLRIEAVAEDGQTAHGRTLLPRP